MKLKLAAISFFFVFSCALNGCFVKTCYRYIQRTFCFDRQPEKSLLAGQQEVDLCRRVFGLQSECSAKPRSIYACLGASMGICMALIKNKSNCLPISSVKSIGKYAFFGALAGSIIRYVINALKMPYIRRKRFANYFPEEYVQTTFSSEFFQRQNEAILDYCNHSEKGEQVPQHSCRGIIPSTPVELTQREIHQWHNLLSDAIHNNLVHYDWYTGNMEIDVSLPHHSHSYPFRLGGLMELIRDGSIDPEKIRRFAW